MGCHRLAGMNTWADKIAALQKRGWTLTALARKAGCHLSTVSDYKHGRTKEPSGMTAVTLHTLYSTGAKPPKQRKRAA